MSTRSFIAKQVGPDAYRTIYCHFDGYLSHNGAMLIDHYNTPEMVDKLLDLGDISVLNKKLDPDPNLPHSFDYKKRQEDVTVAYGRDRGEKGTEARVMTLKQLDDPNNWTVFTYIFTEDNQWKYFVRNHSQEGLKDVKENLEAEYGSLWRIPGYYGGIPDELPKAVAQTKAYTGPTYLDKNGMQIRVGMQLRFPDGSIEKVYATMDAEGEPDLGINASNDTYMKKHNIPEAEREFYPLSSVDIRGAEICEQKIQMNPVMKM